MRAGARQRRVLGGALLVLLAALLAGGQPAWADQFEEQVREQLLLAAMAIGFGDTGYTLDRPPSVGKIHTGPDSSSYVRIPLARGKSHVLVGVCDSDCSDMDLVVHDAAMHKIGEDLQDDDTPMVELVPSQSGEYIVQVLIPACQAYRCTYGIGVFVRE
ncbi:MAG: hypothetical protein AB1634_14920 [Thermodesulfobacteriota bacterium]